MTFNQFINSLCDCGTGGKIFAFIIVIVALVWVIKVFLLPFYISSIDTKVQNIEKYLKDRCKNESGGEPW